MVSKNIILKTQEHLTIREAKIEDAQNMINYMNSILPESSFLSFEPGEFTYTVKQEEEILKSYLESNNQVFLIAEINDTIVGMLNVSANNKKKMKHIGLMSISISKQHWGKKIGSHLVDIMLEWANSTGVIKKVNLIVNVSNLNAIALYKKHGFEIEGTIRRDMLINNEYHDAYHMGVLIN